MDQAYDAGLGWLEGALVRLGHQASPARTAEWLLDRMQRTRRRTLTRAQQAFLDRGLPTNHVVAGRPVPSYWYGRASIQPAVDVFLVHGWGGSTADFSSLVPPMVEAGLSVLGWDAPGHGRAAGSDSSPAELLATLESFLSRWGHPRVVVAHGLGAAVALLSLSRRDGPVRNFIAASPSVVPLGEPTDWAAVGGGEVRSRVSELQHARTGLHPTALSMVPNAAKLRVSGLLSVVHDHADPWTPVSSAYQLVAAVPSACVFLTRGRGHLGTLSAPEAVRNILESVLS